VHTKINNKRKMATLTVSTNRQLISGKGFIHFPEMLNFVPITSTNTKSGIDKALEDVRQGRIFFAKNTKDLMKQTT
jgi:hypothetical protein